MYGYIFETTNTKTGDTYLGKRYAVKFDKDYFGEENDSALAVAIEKYGRTSFTVKMLMPYEDRYAIEMAYNEMLKPKRPKANEPEEEKPKRKKVEEPVAEMPEQKESSDSSGPEEEPVVKEEPKPAKRSRKKKVIENEGK